jgi:hypothetical protein
MYVLRRSVVSADECSGWNEKMMYFDEENEWHSILEPVSARYYRHVYNIPCVA